jgi:hypothetical protein
VRPLAVRLDDQQLLTPDEVALVALDVDVHLGARKAAVVAERQEQLLELGARPCCARLVNGEH